jgi:hypothetical protein
LVIRYRHWSKKLLLLSAAVTLIYFLLLTITNSITMHHLAEAQRYCFGDWNSDCEEVEDEDYDLLCDVDDDGDGLMVFCPEEARLKLEFASVSLNFMGCVLLAPLFFVLLRVRAHISTMRHRELRSEADELSPSILPIRSIALKLPQPELSFDPLSDRPHSSK